MNTLHDYAAEKTLLLTKCERKDHLKIDGRVLCGHSNTKTTGPAEADINTLIDEHDVCGVCLQRWKDRTGVGDRDE